ncbi:hypothetical protein Calag_1094 [Caldisphaera lagunensis DSM 15908]|uniref:Uncharacterized protein n=1 Tax=Caldisphaera lagunensis (strain DSM 15908 / JCM 11604 / ANMR 0165 / IC-154) TaxID=1056495 RepID=L0AAC0_CALLD|nr:hypothetical protein [Caldisphaera lagunensis]AFZ70816.1 hypothetical protein Calag_1094 [Caldisphaera lagunensis DSM 15908]
MGRTTPSTRMVIEDEINRLLKILEYTNEDKDKAKEIIKEAYDLVSYYQFETLSDPLEPIVLGLILYIAKRCS